MTVFHVDQRRAPLRRWQFQRFDSLRHGCAGFAPADDVNFANTAQRVARSSGKEGSIAHANVSQNCGGGIGSSQGGAKDLERLLPQLAFQLHENSGSLRIASTATDGSSLSMGIR